MQGDQSVHARALYGELPASGFYSAIGGMHGKTLVVGGDGDGRFYNRKATWRIIKMAVAGEAAGLVIGAGGLLSTPAASAVMRKRKIVGGLVLSASHNPGGIDEDFGIKFNIAAGGPAAEYASDAIFAISQTVSSYQLAEIVDLDLAQLGIQMIGDACIEIIDPVADYAELMQSPIDFDAIRALFHSCLRMRFDALHAVTGPYACTLLEQQLGAPEGPS